MRPGRLGLALAAIAASAIAGSAPPAAGAIVGTDTVFFATAEQPVWSAAENRSAQFQFDVIDTGPMSQTIGNIGTTNIANPNYAQQVAACGLLDPVCIANVPLFISVPHGARAILTGDVHGGFSGNVALGSNLATVSFALAVDIDLANPDAAPGEVNALRLLPRDETGSLSTQFSLLSANIVGHMEQSHRVRFDVFDGGDHIIDVDYIQPTQFTQREILDLQIGSTEATVSAFGLTAEDVDLATSFTKNVRVPVPNTGGAVQIPLGDVTIYNPNIDIDGPTSVLPPNLPDFPGTHLSGEKMPTDRLQIGGLFQGEGGATEVDFAKLDVDGNVWCPICGSNSIAFQVPSGPLPTPAGIEIRPANTDIGAFFGIGQTAFFDPRLQAHIVFSQPVTILDPVLGPITTSVITRPVDGSTLLFEMPEGDLDIDLVYTLADNAFTDILDLLISPARTVTTLGVEIYGASFLLNPIRGEYALFSDTIPFGDPRNAGNLFTETTTLGGFEDVAGSRLSFARESATAPGAVAVSEPASSALLAIGVLALARSARRRAMRGGAG